MSIREKALADFLDKHKDLPEQGTQEWLDARTYFIGGSSMATILGCNPYQNEKKLIKQRIGLDSFKGFAATWFGNLMEGAITDYVNNQYNCRIYETGSIECTKNKNMSYSPDGLAIIKKQNLNVLDKFHHEHIKNTSLFNDNHEDDDLTVLFEFKCPYKRVPHLTEIPEYYLPQPLLGMDIIDICEVGIFIEAIYRFCSLDDIQYNNKYHTKYHNDKITLTNNPIYYGFILITYNLDLFINLEENEEDDFLDQLESQGQFVHDIENHLNRNKSIKTNINNKVINDLGKLENSWLFNQILQHIIEKKQFNYKHLVHKKEHKFEMDVYDKSKNIKNVYNHELQFNVHQEIDDAIKNLPDNEIIIGVLPYKLFNIYTKPVKKQLDFITPKIKQKVSDVIDIIKECNEGNKTICEKEDIIDKYYPTKRKKNKSK